MHWAKSRLNYTKSRSDNKTADGIIIDNLVNRTGRKFDLKRQVRVLWQLKGLQKSGLVLES